MTNWKVTLEDNGPTLEFTVKAKTYADAFISAHTRYPAGRIKSIKPLEPLEAKQKKITIYDH